MDNTTLEILAALLPLIPAVPVWAFVIERLVELGKAQGFVKGGQAYLWSGGLNALAYIVMYLIASAGYTTAATTLAKQVEAAWPVISAAVSLGILAASSTGLTKLLHNWLDKLNLPAG
jgi:hypothetical protein